MVIIAKDWLAMSQVQKLATLQQQAGDLCKQTFKAVTSSKSQQALNEAYELLSDASIFSSVDELRRYIEQAMSILEDVYTGEK